MPLFDRVITFNSMAKLGWIYFATGFVERYASGNFLHQCPDTLTKKNKMIYSYIFVCCLRMNPVGKAKKRKYNSKSFDWKDMAAEFRDHGNKSSEKESLLMKKYEEYFKGYDNDDSCGRQIRRLIFALTNEEKCLSDDCEDGSNCLPTKFRCKKTLIGGREIDEQMYHQILELLSTNQQITFDIIYESYMSEVRFAIKKGTEFPVSEKTRRKINCETEVLMTFPLLLQKLEKGTSSSRRQVAERFCMRWNLPRKCAKIDGFKTNQLSALAGKLLKEQHALYIESDVYHEVKMELSKQTALKAKKVAAKGLTELLGVTISAAHHSDNVSRHRFGACRGKKIRVQLLNEETGTEMTGDFTNKEYEEEEDDEELDNIRDQNE